MARLEEVISFLRDAGAYPHRPPSVEVRETAISIVFIAGDRVFKVKKPVELPFLDYSEPAQRRALCHEEVRINRRLAPETYLGVCAIVDRDGRLALAPDSADAIEWAVEMRRLPEDRTLASLLERGELTADRVRAVGRRLAAFHAEADAPEDPPGPGAVKRPSDENFQALLDVELAPGVRRRLASAERFFDAFVAGRRDLLAARAACRRIRDGHGDLRLEHVLVLDEGVIAYDAVEFDPALRRIDVAADIAFLVMELAAAGADQLAGALVDAYRDAGGDPGDDSLLAFYGGYRATVRAKLALIAGDDATALLDVAERFRWRARLPLVLVLCGVTATGKTTVAQAVGEASGMPVLSSDRVRKRLAGVAPTARARDEQYGPEASRRTYCELGTRAAERARAGGGAIVDATFRRRDGRRAFLEALGSVSPVFVECRAPRDVLLERARGREADPARVSDATAAMVDRQLGEWDPLDEIAAGGHLVLRSDRRAWEIVDDLEALLDARLARTRL